MIRRLALLSIVALLAADSLPAATKVWVVRHAEKAHDGTQDPPLNEEGRSRAAALAELLAGEKIVAIYTTKYRRTSETAAPVAELHRLQPTVYEPTDFAAVATKARMHDGGVLIVGHSNTVPPIVAALGGKVAGPIDESDYGTLYMLTIDDDGTVLTDLVDQPSRTAAE